MKCVRCQTNNNLRERRKAGGRCKYCGHPFVFDPKVGSKFTDTFFYNSLKDISLSSENTLFFTPKQLWYFIEKRLISKKIDINTSVIFLFSIILLLIGRLNGNLIGSLFLASFITFFSLILYSIWVSQSHDYKPKTRRYFARSIQVIGELIILCLFVLVYFLIFFTVTNTVFTVITEELILLIFGTALGIFLIYLGTRQLRIQHKIPQSFKFKQTEITQWLSRWEKINGKVTNFLPPSRETSEPTEINSEITAYSFDRVIVCDTAKIAQFLIANNFHFEHNCAVLSIDGYPQNIFTTVMEMLRQNSDLKVYAFHDATPHGVSIINQLRTNPNWFMGNNLSIYDLGLLPRHVFASKNMWILKSDESARQAQRISVNVKQTLSTDEIAWLEEGFYVELESFSPRKLLQVASQGIVKTQAIANGYSSGSDSSLDSPDSGDIVINFDDNSSSQNIVFFASDSFG